MNPHYFSIIQKGLTGELEALALPEVLDHLAVIQEHFLLEPSTISAYVNRLLSEFSDGPINPQGLDTLKYLLAKYERLDPLETNVLGLLRKVVDAPELARRMEILAALTKDAKTWERARTAMDRLDFDEARPGLTALLDLNPADVQAGAALSMIDMYQGKAPGERLLALTPPKPLAPAWNRLLFTHLAAMGENEAALARFALLGSADKNEVVLNAAAELYRKTDQTGPAMDLYRLSLAKDPSQAPVRLRLAELETPFRPKPELTGERAVSICLYSYNKADLLFRTLKGLATSRIGGAAVTVLINGCSDESLSAAETARTLFPNNPYEIINLPVNVGAPAARNWLINRKLTRESDYAAFLDDDVDVPPDWLEKYLTVMEDRPKAGVVGCKILDPGQPARYQYLYRGVSQASEELLKLTPARPARQYDNGLYDFIRETDSVMGCLHLFRREALEAAPLFDIRFSPSQVDDIDHDLMLRLAGFEVIYCGLVACVHNQSSGLSEKTLSNDLAFGNAVGNDVKLFYKHLDHMEKLRELGRAWRPKGTA
jgi:GT2 family glycosyltransferase